MNLHGKKRQVVYPKNLIQGEKITPCLSCHPATTMPLFHTGRQAFIEETTELHSGGF